MNANHSVELLIYGVIVAGVSLFAHRISPGLAGATQTLLVAGGLFVILTGVLGFCGLRRRFWPIAALIMVAGLLLVPVAGAWLAVKSGAEGIKPVAVILSVLLLFAIIQLAHLVKPDVDLNARERNDAKSPGSDDRGSGEAPDRNRPSLDEGR